MATSQQLVDGWQTATEQIRKRVLAYVLAVWGNSPSYRDEDVSRLIARILPVVQSGQLQVAQLTDAYIGRMAALAGVTWASGVARAEIIDYRGIPPVEVYRRPATTIYTALSKGVSYLDAVARSEARLGSLVATDLQQAKNRQATASIGRSGFSLFRRVLTGAENCGLCAIASTNTYSRGDLMPIHPDCDCGVEPIVRRAASSVPASVLTQTRGIISNRSGSTAEGPLSSFRDLITVNTHGELGPTLGWASDHFTSAADLGL